MNSLETKELKMFIERAETELKPASGKDGMLCWNVVVPMLCREVMRLKVNCGERD